MPKMPFEALKCPVPGCGAKRWTIAQLQSHINKKHPDRKK